MNVISLPEVQKKTSEFLSLHWPTGAWGPMPFWSEPWKFRGSLPQGDKQGVYALLDTDEQVIYLGVGASLGRGIYEGYGLGARTGSYTRVAPGGRGVPPPERRYVPAPDWVERRLASICTLGLEPTQAYLAYGLEAFLLSIFHPPFNSVRAARAPNV